MPRPRARNLFELGGQWIAAEPGRRGFYRFWTDAGTGRTRRASLGTTDFERAKEKLAEIVVRGAPRRADDYLSVVLESYFEDRTDGKPSEKQTRSNGKTLLLGLGAEVRVPDLTDAKQKEFAQWCLTQGWRLSHVARCLGVAATAIRHAGIPAPRIVINDNVMREKWNLIDPAPLRRFIPTDEQLGRALSADMPEKLFRFIILQMATAGRPQTAVDVEPGMRVREAKLLHLNPPDRRQNKKFRATVREGKVLRGWLDKWEKAGLDAYGGHYCGYDTIEGVKTALQALRVRKGVNLPRLSTYSFRHKVTSVLRAAGVPEDQVSIMLGHRRANLRTTAGYGEWAPGYLAEAAAAIDAWFARVQKHCSRALYSHGIPTTIRGRRKRAA